jgi:two-component system chemotaxis response regulator CheY
MTKILLLVSDSRVSRMMIKTVVLQLQPDWQVLEASDGIAALERTRNQTFDIAILQLTASSLDGLELAEKLMIKHPQSDYALIADNTKNVVDNKAVKLGLSLIEKPVTEAKLKAFLSNC